MSLANPPAFFSALREGLLGPTLSPDEVSDVSPGQAASNATRGGFAQPVGAANLRQLARGRPNGPSIVGRNFGHAVPLAASQHAMPGGIGGVLAGVPVFEIVGPVVQRVPVDVADHRAPLGRRPKERGGHKPVDQSRLSPAVNAERDLMSPRARYRKPQNPRQSAATIRNISPDPPKVGNRVVGGGLNNPPILFFSHAGIVS